MTDNNEGDGWSSFWIPAGFACLFFIIILLFAYLSYQETQSQIEENINKKFNHIAPQPVFIPKYDSITQARLDTIEADRQIRHWRVDSLVNADLQSLLDSIYNR